MSRPPADTRRLPYSLDRRTVLRLDQARPMAPGQALLEMSALLGLYLLLHILIDIILIPTYGVPLIAREPFFINFFRFHILRSPGGVDFVIYTAIFLLSWIAAFLYGRLRKDLSFLACFGLFILIYYLARQAWGLVPDLQTVFDPTSVAPAVPREVWYRAVVIKLFQEFVLPLFGILLLFGAVPGFRATASAAFTKGRAVLRRLGVGVRHSPTVDVMHGLWTFAVILFGAIVSAYVANRFAATGDESQVFSRVTLDLVFLISIAAGLGEEFIYRVVLLGALVAAFRVTGYRGARNLTLFSLAVFIQALAFGLVHAGYGTLSHLITPFLFGIVIALVFVRFGFIPAVLVHFLIDVMALGAPFAVQYPIFGWFLWTLLLGSVFVPAVYFLVRGLYWLEDTGRLMGRLVAS